MRSSQEAGDVVSGKTRMMRVMRPAADNTASEAAHDASRSDAPLDPPPGKTHNRCAPTGNGMSWRIPALSGIHASVFPSGWTWRLRDEHSTNGTFLNGNKGGDAALRKTADVIQLSPACQPPSVS